MENMASLTPNTLYYQNSASAALDELATAETHLQLLELAHSMWCSPSCTKDSLCGFLHYWRLGSLNDSTTGCDIRSRYNKDTAHLFTLMGGDGYVQDTPQKHQVNTWTLLEAALHKIDNVQKHSGMLYFDYTDWTKKNDNSARQTVQSACRDAVQFVSTWCGSDYKNIPGLHYIAFATIADDMCIPPLDLVTGRFKIYGRSLTDVVRNMVREGWGRDATHALLSLIRQYIVQYVEKAQFGDFGDDFFGLHAVLNQSDTVWDSVIYRTHTANTYGSAILAARIAGLGPLTANWIFDSSICDCISMDLCKSAMRIYDQDNHRPTASTGKYEMQLRRRGLREAGYHSIYLDLVDGLAHSGAPEPIIHFATAGFLYVPICHRYLERRAGYRFPIHRAMVGELQSIFGDEPTDALLDGLFHLRWLASQEISDQYSGVTANEGSWLALSSICMKRQQQRKIQWEHTSTANQSSRRCSMHTNSVSDGIHALGQTINSPADVPNLLNLMCNLLQVPLLRKEVDKPDLLQGIWALCVACQVDCGDQCEWAAFIQYCAVGNKNATPAVEE